MSLDGYVADQNGNVDWLSGDNSDPEDAGSYPEFYETVDTVIMGFRTYHQIVTELSPNGWPYEGKQTYVITHIFFYYLNSDFFNFEEADNSAD